MQGKHGEAGKALPKLQNNNSIFCPKHLAICALLLQKILRFHSKSLRIKQFE
jgi:hypothetical protein